MLPGKERLQGPRLLAAMLGERHVGAARVFAQPAPGRLAMPDQPDFALRTLHAVISHRVGHSLMVPHAARTCTLRTVMRDLPSMPLLRLAWNIVGLRPGRAGSGAFDATTAEPVPVLARQSRLRRH
jgi:hypothetical protein